MNSRSPISAQANAISEPPESQHQVKPDHNNNIVRRANNRSLSSSLRRLITITFTNGGSSRKKKKCRASNIKQNHNNIDIDDNNIIGSNNNNINGDNNSIGDANSLAAINNNSLAAAGSSSNSSKKQTRDKISIYKHNNDYLTRTNTLFGNKRGQFSLVGTDSLSLQAPTLATSKSDNNKNGNAKISFSFSRSSNQLNNNSNSDNNSNKVGRTIFRRSSQPPISNFNDPSTTLSQSKTQAATTGSDTLSLGGRRIIKKTNYSINSAALSSSWVLTDDDGEENADSYVEKHETNGVGLMTNSENKKEKISDNNYSKGQKQKFNSKSNKEQQNGKGAGQFIECPLCVFPITEPPPYLASCKHKVCLECLQRYITTEINHSRLNITCPVCSEPIHPNTIKNILQNQDYYLKYESFMLRRVLAGEPDARWCPAPDCGYVVLANGCASCPRLVCGRDGCKTSFCYHCKQEWHPNQTCSAANIQRNKGQMAQAYQHELLYNEDLILSATSNAAGSVGTGNNRKSSKSSQVTGSIKADDIKECPVCTSRIVKMNDGSCNHMTCSICETEFCWLCMKEISDLHYFSPSGCTFWGKKPWSRKKKLLWQLGMLVGAPICIILIAGIAVPAIVIGIPVWAARKLHNRLERKPSISRYRKNAIITGGVILSFLISPIISAIALSFGVPILLGYVYGVVPLSLCRSSGGCLSRAASLENLQNNIQQRVQAVSPFNLNLGGNSNNNNNTPYNNKDGISIDSRLATSITSHKLNGSVGEVTNVGNTTIGDLSIGETSIYMSNISLETNSIGLSAGPTGSVVRCSDDRESASNAALAGSIYSGNNASNNLNDDGNSIRALAGSIISKRSAGTSGGGYTLIPAEVHSTTQEVAPSTIAIPGTNMDTK